ncbi:uncharacterized protein LOC129602093 isoform X2 [Paramacrobiotus metropolitanus]|uniref:uncharacterized protein LOC129602093 isoform X2 n=1 Tax=Paramacrobiotus metropolitanus TaxID=2943436 RepID=UPI0024457021|nr:uncharacterized protein LOC129602093 isoform X2 [Paramacrobiotus metropolitanus]
MLVFGDDEADVWEWNAVAVLVDGRLQRGEVINVAEGGLIVDFGCRARRSQFVEYERIFRFSNQDLFGSPGMKLLVLLRYHPDDAWTWYAGHSLPLQSDGFLEDLEFVRVELPQGNTMELVPYPQLREPFTERRVQRDDFVIRWCPLPDTYSSADPQRLRELLEEKTIQSRHSCNMLCTAVHSQEELLNWRSSRTLELVRHQSTTSPPRTRRKVCGMNSALPVELLVEVFQALDSIERVRGRRVCPLWNSILTTESHFPDVRVSGKPGYHGRLPVREEGTYWVLACLLKCLTPATRVAVVMHLTADNNGNVAEPINHTFNAHHRLPTLVFYDCEFGDDRTFGRDVIVVTAHDAAQCACQRILWKHCRVFHSCSEPIAIAQHTFSVRCRQDMMMQMFELFEQTLVWPRPLNLPELSAWISKAVAANEAHIIVVILGTLKCCQSADPRPTTQYRGRDWQVSHLAGLDVRTLTPLTAAFLTQALIEHVPVLYK